MEKEDIKTALEAVSNFGINIAGDFVLEKHVENEVANVESGGIGIQIVKSPSFKPNVIKGEQKQVKNKQKPRETMTFKRASCVLDGHLTVLFNLLTKAGWIEGNEADFKALFSGRRDEDCIITWSDKFGKAALFTLFNVLSQEELVIIPDGFGISSILQGHFKDKTGQWLSGLDKGNKAHAAAMPVIWECVKILKAGLNGYFDNEEDTSGVYDPFNKELHLHKW